MDKDRRELLKLRQGLIAEEETVLEVNQKPHYEKPVGFNAVVANFCYHHKVHIIITAFFVFVVAGMVLMSLGGEKPDITVLVIVDDFEVARFIHREQRPLQTSLERFVPDFTGNGNIFAECLLIDLVVAENRDPRAYHGSSVKLFGEVQSGNSLIFIGNRHALENIPRTANVHLSGFYLNLAELYPNFAESAITDEFFLQLSLTALADADFENVPMPDDLFLVVRIPPAERAEETLLVLDNIITGTAVTVPGYSG
jgi:hypothetical protein